MVTYPSAVKSLVKETTNAHYQLLRCMYYYTYF